MPEYVILHHLESSELSRLPSNQYEEPVVVCGTSPRELKYFAEWIRANKGKPFRKLIIPYTDNETCLSLGNYLCEPEEKRSPVIRSRIRAFPPDYKFSISKPIEWDFETEEELDVIFQSWPCPDNFTVSHILACATLHYKEMFYIDTRDGLTHVQREAFKKTPGYFKSICLSVANEQAIDYPIVRDHLLKTLDVKDVEYGYLPRINIRLPALHIVENFEELKNHVLCVLQNKKLPSSSYPLLTIKHENRVYKDFTLEKVMRLFVSQQILNYDSREFQRNHEESLYLKGIALYHLRDEIFEANDKKKVLETKRLKWDVNDMLNTPIKYVCPLNIAESKHEGTMTEAEQLKADILSMKTRPGTL